MLSFRSKVWLVADKLPFTRTDRHARFIQETFTNDLFSPQQLTQVLDQVVKNYTDSMAGIENQMLVKIRADISGLPPSLFPAFASEARLNQAFEKALKEATHRANADLAGTISRETISTIVGEVLTQVAVRMGVSAGLLAAGGVSGTMTLGIGLAVGLIVDQIVSWVWDWWCDPVGDLSQKMSMHLDNLLYMILEGDGDAPGLRPRLEEFARTRAALREQAVTDLLRGSEVQGCP